MVDWLCGRARRFGLRFEAPAVRLAGSGELGDVVAASRGLAPLRAFALPSAASAIADATGLELLQARLEKSQLRRIHVVLLAHGPDFIFGQESAFCVHGGA